MPLLFRLDPCGIICILITYSAVFYSDFVIIKWIVLTNFYDSLWGTFHTLLFNLVILLLVGSHVRAVVSDPGLIPLPQARHDFSEYYEQSKDEEYSVCGRCEAWRPPRAHHCRICKRCVRRMDHHCPWINNCVGEYNQKYFIQFLFYVGLLSLYAGGLVIYSWTSGAECLYCPKDLLTKQSKILHSVLLMLECILFGMFVLAIMIDQLSAIFSDETAVEHVKRTHQIRPSSSSHHTSPTSSSTYHSPLPRKPKMTLLGEVCGRGPVLLWLLPCHSLPHSKTEATIHSNNYTV